jgi:hypothetical protein
LNHPALNTIEHRVALNTQWISRGGVELNLGGYFGNTSVVESSERMTYGAYTSFIIPASRKIWLQANLRQEKNLLGTFRIAALGIKMRFEK